MADQPVPQDPIETEALYDAYETGSINIPATQNFNTPAMDGSMQQFLADNLGSFVVVEFLVGTGQLVEKAGILYALGSSILTLYEEISQTFITCDIYSVKFVTFFLPGHRPWQIVNPIFNQSGMGRPNFLHAGATLQSPPSWGPTVQSQPGWGQTAQGQPTWDQTAQSQPMPNPSGPNWG